MSGREWKPGDVALVTWAYDNSPPLLMFRVTSDNCRKDHGAADHWHSIRGTWATSIKGADASRSLVVVDPHDLAAVERLQDLYISAESKGLSGLSMQAALTEFANPKPPEPTGLGAVVEDAEGWLWVRTGGPNSHPWASNDDDETRARWSYISAVRVFSEGVTP